MVLLPRRAAQSRPLVSSAHAGRQEQSEDIDLQVPGAPPSPGEPHRGHTRYPGWRAMVLGEEPRAAGTRSYGQDQSGDCALSAWPARPGLQQVWMSMSSKHGWCPVMHNCCPAQWLHTDPLASSPTSFPRVLQILLGAGGKVRKRASFLEGAKGLCPSGCRVQNPSWMQRRVRASQASPKVLKQPNTTALGAAPPTHSGLAMQLAQEVGEADPCSETLGQMAWVGGQPQALVPHFKARR